MRFSPCHQQQYQYAEQERSFKRLLPYACQLLRWQLHHSEDRKRVAKIASHLHGLFHTRRCSDATIAHPKPHGSCGPDCIVIDAWLTKELQLHVLSILRSRLSTLPQQTLL